MSFAELLRESIAALRAHALRSFLTLLGIIIGVSTIVGVVAVISGLNAYVRERIIILSPDVFLLTKFGIIRGRDEFVAALKRPDIQWRDFERLRATLQETDAIAAQQVGSQAVRYGDKRLPDIQVIGATANYPQLVNVDLAAGRFFAEPEAHMAQGFAIIGWDIKDELFPHLDPLGREITIGSLRCKVIGLVRKQGQLLGQNQDNRVYIPIQTFRATFGSRQSIDLLLRARGGVPELARAVDEARAVLRALRHTSFKASDPFGVITAEALQTLWAQISTAAFTLMFLISTVSLGVGGIVIMNIMLVSVIERTQEIGVRKAVGATESDIRRQFLLEATMLSLAGGVIGVLLGAGAAYIVRHVVDFPAQITSVIIVLALALSAVVGVIAGYWPARNASRLNPIDALRAE